MARSHPETWLITENNVRRTNTGEEGLRETNLRPGQIKTESMKMETCHTAEGLALLPADLYHTWRND